MGYSEPIEIIKAKEFFQSGKFEEAFQNVKDFETKESITKNEKILCWITKSSFYHRLGKKEDFFNVIKLIGQINKKIKEDLILVDIYIEMAKAESWSTIEKPPDYDKSHELVLKGENLLDTLTKISEAEYERRKLKIELVKAIILNEKRENEKSLLVLKNCIPLAEKYNQKVDLVWVLGVIGQIFHHNGDLKSAINYYNQSLEIAEEINYEVMIQACHNGVGIIYSSQGELDLAIKHYENALVIGKKIEYNFGIAACYINLGYIFQQKGNYMRAQEYYENSYKIFRSSGSLGHSSLRGLFDLAIEKGDIESAQTYLYQIKQITEETKNKNVEITYRVAQAILLKSSPRSLNRGKAEEILKEVVNGEISNYDSTLDALINLCDLLLSELNNTGIIEIIDELNVYIAKLFTVAKQNQSYLVLAEACLLQARLSLLTFDFKETRQALSNAQEIAEIYGLKRLAVKISNEHDEFLKKQEL
jgi:tetratricopeptide (TPR) repeat protein